MHGGAHYEQSSLPIPKGQVIGHEKIRSRSLSRMQQQKEQT